jgi:hypothetical protein
MGLIRVLAPLTPSTVTHVVCGRTYAAAAGATLDVPDFDVSVLVANGWQILAADGVGTTPQRPAKPKRGMEFLDTTLGVHITFDGASWRNTATGATV